VRIKEIISEAANAAQQAAIAINMKKQGKKPKEETDEADENLNEIQKGQKDSNGYTKCWPGHHAAGTKKGKNGGQVRNCVKDESIDLSTANQIDEDLELESDFDMIEEMVEHWAELHGVDPDVIWEDLESVDDLDLLEEAEAWQKKSGKNKNGGLNKKGVASYRKSHPGSKLQTAVTTKPSKLKKGSKASKRRKSFCARMKGMKKHRTGAKTAHDPNSRINKSLRKWHCESIEEMRDMILNAETYIAEAKQRLDAKCWKGKHKEGTKMKGGIRVNNCVPNESVDEAANAAQQAAIAIAKKKDRGVDENFADGKGPGRPGDSARHGIPKHATKAELEKASHAKGRKGQLARWQLNMRNGKS